MNKQELLNWFNVKLLSKGSNLSESMFEEILELINDKIKKTRIEEREIACLQIANMKESSNVWKLIAMKAIRNPTEMYFCPSYVNDDRKLVDCKCGKCEEPK